MQDWYQTTIGEMFDRTAKDYGDREALVFQDRRYSYRELKELVDMLARGLIKLGIAKGEKVGICMPNYPQFIITDLALAKIGAVGVFVNTRFKTGEVQFCLEKGDITTLIMADEFLTNYYCNMIYDICPELKSCLPGELKSEKLPLLKRVICLSEKSYPGMYNFDDVLSFGNNSALNADLNARMSQINSKDAVNMFWTSGTTSFPKGVLHNHTVLENIWNYSQILGYSFNDRCLIPSPMFYTTSNFYAFLVAVMHGACMLPLIFFTTDEILTTIEKEKATAIVGMITSYIRILEYPDFDKYDLSSLKRGWTGGGTTPIGVVKAVKEKIGIETFCQVYGMTETHGITSMTLPGDSLEKIAYTVGKPLPGFDLDFIDPDTMEKLEPGTPGELVVKGRRVPLGYYNLTPEEQSRFYTPDGAFRTGDILKQDSDGYLVFLGRSKDMIKAGGENLASSEVEQVLYDHPAIVQAAVFGIPDEKHGEAVVAALQCKPGFTGGEQEIRDWCKKRIATFKVPKHYFFIKEDSDWPYTTTGKIQKYVLKERYLGNK